MEKEFWEDYFKTLGEAIKRLQEVLSHPLLDQDSLYQDAAIQRFEFCIELFWKVLKKFLAYEKVLSTTPRDVIQKAFQFSLIDDEQIWLTMMDDRNKISHVYKQEEAHRVFENIKTYYPVMQRTYDKLKEKFKN